MKKTLNGRMNLILKRFKSIFPALLLTGSAAYAGELLAPSHSVRLVTSDGAPISDVAVEAQYYVEAFGVSSVASPLGCSLPSLGWHREEGLTFRSRTLTDADGRASFSEISRKLKPFTRQVESYNAAYVFTNRITLSTRIDGQAPIPCDASVFPSHLDELFTQAVINPRTEFDPDRGGDFWLGYSNMLHFVSVRSEGSRDFTLRLKFDAALMSEYRRQVASACEKTARDFVEARGRLPEQIYLTNAVDFPGRCEASWTACGKNPAVIDDRY